MLRSHRKDRVVAGANALVTQPNCPEFPKFVRDAGLLPWGRHSCLPVGVTFQSPQAGLESPANRQVGMPASALIGPQYQVLSFGIVLISSSARLRPLGSRGRRRDCRDLVAM